MRRRRVNHNALPSQEEILADYARRLKNHQSGRRAVHIHISRLSRESHHIQDLRIAAETFNGLIKKHEGQLFRLLNHDMVFVGKDVSLPALDEVVLRLRYMFRDDPQFKILESRRGPERAADPFCTYFDLETDYAAFLATATSLYENEPDGSSPDNSVISFATAEKKPTKPITVDLNIAQRAGVKTVYAMTRDGVTTAILNEVCFEIEAVKLHVRHHPKLADRGMANDKWLLRVLTDLFDGDSAAALLTTARIPHALTLPLSIQSALTSEFTAFNSHYRQVTRTAIMVEFSATELLQNPGKFFAARDKVLECGHKICVSGWDPHAFALIKPERLDVHFHKIAWAPAWALEFRNDCTPTLTETIKSAGATKVILTDCLGPEAIAFGHRHGVLLYQGPHVDKLATKPTEATALS